MFLSGHEFTQISCSIIGSLAGTSYYGPVAGHGVMTHDLDLIRMERKKHEVERTGTVGGDVEALPASESSDSYVVLKKRQDEKEGKGGDAGKESK